MSILDRIKSFSISTQKTPIAKQRVQQTRNREISKNNKMVIDKIVSNYKDQSRKDIDKWRLSLTMLNHPERPRRNFHIDLLDDLKTDGHFVSLKNLRKDTILNSPFSIKDNGVLNEEATKFFNRSWFYNFLDTCMESKIIGGHAFVEFQYFLDNDVVFKEIPKRNTVPLKKIIIPDLSKEDTINFEDDYFKDWAIEIGERDDLGISNNIVHNLIWKRNVAQAWMEFCEKFGQPIATATTNDESQVEKIQYLLDQLGEAASAVFPVGTTIDLKEANRTDAYQTYEHFIKYNKDEIAVPIVGGTMITSDGSSRSQSEVHERNLDKKIAMSDKRSLCFLVNDKLVPLLRNQGYTFLTENSQLSFDESHGLNLEKYWTIVKGVMETREVPDEFLTKTFYIPIEGKKKILTPTKPIVKTQGFKTPNYTAKCCDTDKEHTGFTAKGFFEFDRELETLHKDFINKIWANKNTIAERAKISVTEAVKLSNGLFKGWGKRRTKAAWNEPDHLAMHFMEFNLFEFAHTKTEARLAAINELLIDKDKLEIRNYKQFEKLALERVSTLNKAYLRTEHNLSVAVGQGAAAYHRALSEKDTVTTYVQYQTAGDSKVRDSHRLLDGKIFNLSDPEAMRLWPPNAYGCRCEMVQYIGEPKKITKGKDAINLLSDNFAQSKFAVNRGDLKKVFTKDQFYTPDVSGLKNINQLNYESYDLQKYSSFKQRLKDLKTDNTITSDNVNELFVPAVGATNFMEFEDYLKRNILISKKVFNTHTSGKYLTKTEGFRHQLFPFVNDVLSSPTEVWLHSYGNNRFQVRYIKTYNNKTIVVDAKITAQGMEIQTWYTLKKHEKEIRIGLLIKGKDL